MNSENEVPQIIRQVEVVSTNNSLRELIRGGDLPEGSAVVADFQTGGRGQIGNVWESETGKNLTFSVVLYPDCIPARSQFLISQITALSVKETLAHYVDNLSIKWPNDIYWNERKICGMLIENDLSGNNIYCSVIGIGINLNQMVFWGEAPNPVSLTQITGEIYDRDEVLNRFLHIFYAYYLQLLQDKQTEIREAYQLALYRKQGYYRYKDGNGEFEAVIYAIEPTGHLVLQLRDGSRRRYAFKEVTYIK